MFRNRSSLLLVLILVVSAVLRFWGCDFGLPGKFRPDEEYLTSRAFGFLSGDLNPHFFIYPSLYMYVLSVVYWVCKVFGEMFGYFGSGNFESYVWAHQFGTAHYIARCTTAFIGVLGVYATYLLGRKIYGHAEGVVAAIIISVNFVHVRESHFATTDIPMTCLSTLALIAIIDVYKKGRVRDYVLAGALLGLSMSTKYTALAFGVPLGVAHIAKMIGKRDFALFSGVKESLACGVSGIFFFFLGTPFLLLDYKTFLENLKYQAPFLKNGLDGVGIDYGAKWLFNFALWYGAEPTIMILSMIAIGATIVVWIRDRDRAEGAILSSLVISLSYVFMSSRWIFLRYIVTFMPILSVLSAGLLLKICRSGVHERVVGVTAGLLAILLSYGSIYRVIHSNILLSSLDTRIEAAEWINKNIPSKEKIITHAYFWYAKPQLETGDRFVDLPLLSASTETQRLERPNWVLLDSHPISYFSPQPSQEYQAIINSDYELVKEFSPFIGDESKAIFDKADAFYIPIDGFQHVNRAGPRLRIYRAKRGL